MRSFLSFLFLLLISVDGYSLPDYKVTLKAEKVALKHIFRDIEQQTGLYFMYSTTHLKEEEKVSIHVTDKKLDEVLHALLDARGIRWELKDKAIVLRAAEKKASTGNNAVTEPVVRGIVTDINGIPLPGATILLKGSKIGTATDMAGAFSLTNTPDNSVIIVSYTGYLSKEIKLIGKNDLTDLKIMMEQTVNDINEAVVVAYGNTTQRKNVGALTVVKGETIENLPNRSFDRSLQGQVPGLLITPGNGQPGGGTSNIVLRGIGTGTNVEKGSTIRNPLFIIDGVQITQDHLQPGIAYMSTPVSNPLAQINPSDIENITVLKDATAIALYGSRASNGVILITTKHGKSGKTSINVRHQTDVASRLKGEINVLNKDQYLELLYESYRNSNPGFWTDDRIKSDLITKFPYYVTSPGDTAFYETPDLFKELYNPSATTVSNDISLSGGNDNSIYYLNLEYTSQKGIVKKTGYDRASVRYNFSTTPAKWINIGINSMFSYNKQNLQGFFEDGSVASSLPYTLSPLLPVKLQNNTYQWVYGYGGPSSSPSNQISNPVASLELNTNRIESYRGLGNIYGEITLLKEIKFRSSLGADVIQSNNRQKIDPRLSEYSSYQYIGPSGFISEGSISRTTITSTNTLQAAKTLSEKHLLTAILGQEAQILRSNTVQALGMGFTSPAFENVFNAAMQFVQTSSQKNTLLSYFGQLNYDYDNRYLLSISGRNDGSSRFGQKAQFNSYWSAGAGWIISSEPILANTKSWLNYAKIRGSVGLAGSSNTIPPGTRFDILKQGNFAGQYPSVRTNGTPANPLIKPERTFNQDLGIEAQFLKERIGFTLDFYKRKTSDLLYSMMIPVSSGGQSITGNIGDIINKGTELSVVLDVIRNKNTTWNIQANWSTNKNVLEKTNGTLQSQTSSYNNLINKVGENFNSFFLVRWAGVNPSDGSPEWYDTTGQRTSIYSAAHRVISGKPQPDGFGGITNNIRYNNFELSFFLYYQYGFQIYDYASASLLNDGGKAPYMNQHIDALDRWQKPGDITQNPIRILNNPKSTSQSAKSTRYLYDGDFIRLKNISISYNFPSPVLKKTGLRALKVYIQANNIATWTRYPGIDPETANLGGEGAFPYPQQKNWSIGVNAQL